MVESDHIRAIAVDGGGTHCRLALINGDRVEFVVSGAANASSNFSDSVESITSGLRALAERTHSSLDMFGELPAYVGLAGVIDDRIAQKMRCALPFKNASVHDDRMAALRGALSTKNGVLAHCGTGSFFGIQKNGTHKLAGGWGPVLEDVASSNWIGVRALRRVLYAEDGLEDGSRLTKYLLDQYGGASDLVRFAASATATDFGQIAKDVTRFAEQQDPVAVRTLSDGANRIADMLNKFGWVARDTICLTGGLGPHYQPYLPVCMQPYIQTPIGQPLDGAVALAREYATRLAE